MKILWIARTCPFPANDGEKLRVFNLLRALAPLHQLTLVCRVMADEEEAGLEVLRALGIRVIGVRIPPPASHLQRLRMVLPFVFSPYPVALCTVYFAQMRDALAALAQEEVFDVVQVEHSSLSIYLERVTFRGTPSFVLTMHNIDYLRNERLLETTRASLRKLFLYFNQLRFKSWELSVVRRYQRVVVMSAFDGEVLRQDLPDIAIDVVPNGVDCQNLAYAGPQAGRHAIAYVASMDSDANHDGAMFFLREVWPQVRAQCPQATLSLVGRGPKPELLAMHDGRQVFVTGSVADVQPYYRSAALVVVPLLSGGGTRLKILEAMAMGTPIVSTTVGAEGIAVVSGEHLLLADTAADFAAAVLRLLRDPALAARLSSHARALAESCYDWQGLARAQDAVYRKAVCHADA